MSAVQRRLASIMFSDMVGYSALAQRNELLAIALLEEHRKLLRGIFAQHGGREMDAVGDGFFVEFSSAVDATACAIAIQKALVERNATASNERQIHVRIGLHLGDVVVEGERVMGDGVNIAARIQPLAQPGEILLSEDVARQVQNKIDTPLENLGPKTLKNIASPMQIYRLRLPWQEAAGKAANPTSPQASGLFIRWMLAGAVLLLVVSTSALYLFQNRSAPSLPAGRPRLAVLPFANLSADQENEYFVDGMTEELISRLSRIKGIDVIARTSIMQYKGKQVSIADVGRHLNVNTVLEGSVRKARDKVRITVQLIDAATQGHLWSQDYDRNLKDIFSTQSDISGRVAEALHIVLESADKSGGSFRNVDDTQTYSLYLKGRYYWGKITPEGLRKAIEYFEQAVARSPKDARSWAGLADAHTWLAWNSFAAPTESFPKAKAAAEKALSLDENLADAYASLGLVRFLFEWDWAGAEESFRRAIELAPSNAMAHLWYGIWAKALGLNEKAVEEMRRAVELDPLSLLASAEIGWVAYYGRRFGEAERSCRKTLEMDRDFLFALQCLTFALTLQKNPEAIAVAKRITELTPGDPYMLGQLGWVYGALNKQRDAERVLNTLKEMARKQPVPPTALYQVYSGLRDTRSAIDALEQVQQQRGADVIWIKAGPEFDPLRDDPRFLSLLRSMKFPP